MTNAELIEKLRILQNKNSLSLYKREVCRDAADALEADDKRIAELSLDCEMYQQKCMELDAKMKTVTDCHTSGEGER